MASPAVEHLFEFQITVITNYNHIFEPVVLQTTSCMWVDIYLIIEQYLP